MKQTKTFQLVVLIVFIAGAIFGILIFAGKIDIGKSVTQTGPTGMVTVWGTYDADEVDRVLRDLNNKNTFKIRYVYKPERNFHEDLIEAMALGQGPDLFFVDNKSIGQYLNKIYTIPYISYPLANFSANFVGAGEVFLNSKGVLALPVTVDPLVLYYNKSLLDYEGIVYPPSYWNELAEYNQKLTKKDEDNLISQSAFALGRYSNVNHAKDILSALFLQTENKIVTEKDGRYTSVLNEENKNSNYNPTSMLDFYVSFSNPLNENYTWNKSRPLSQDAFSQEDLVFYFGLASDLQTLIQKNPNQNFAVAPVPQIKDLGNRITSANVQGVAISAFTKNLNASFSAALVLSDSLFANTISTTTRIPPARRNLLAKIPTSDAYLPIFYNSALFARSWIDPLATETDKVFYSMVNDVLINKYDSKESLLRSYVRISNLFHR